IDTVAGRAGVSGFAGDGSLGLGALLNTPTGVAVAADGSVFIADSGNHRIRKVAPNGVISTVAGLGTCGDSGDGALATLAQLCQPNDVMVLPGGVLVVADTGNHRLRRLDASGVISALAGTGTMGASGDGGPALSAQLLSPRALAFDGVDSLFVATGARIRRIRLTSGSIDAFAGNGAMATTVTDGVQATMVPLGTVTAMDWTAAGLLVADSAAERVRLVRTNGLIDTVAGAGPGADGVGGVATRALVEAPVGLAFGPDGTVYVSSGHAVLKVAADGTWQAVAGRRDEAGFSGDGANARQARLSSPEGLAFARDGSLYIADRGNHRLRRVSPSGVISTVVGTGVAGFSGDEGPGVLGQLSGPRGVAVDGEGLVLIADTGNHRIRRLEADGRLSTLVGTVVAGLAGDGVGVRATLLNAPADVSVGPSGDVYIADSGNQRVRRISPLGQVWTVMGRTGCTVTTTGLAANACLSLPTGVFASRDGVYVADAQAGRVWLVDDGGQLTLVAGSGGAAFSGDRGAATQASLRQPRRVGVMASGLVVVADTGNARVRTVVTARGVRNAAEVAVPSADGSLVHVFRESTKQHLRTVSARTGRVVASFEYDALGRLTAMTDDEGRRTTVSWDARGPTSVVGPYGDVNRLAVDGNGYLSRVDKPGGESVQLAHTATGLLTDMVDETGARHRFEYEVDGRLRVDTNAVGGLKALSWSRAVTTGRETETVTLRTAANRVTAYETTRRADGREEKRTTWPDGTVTTTLVGLDDSTVETSADGTVTTTQLAPHARFGTLSPVAGLVTVRLPSGLTQRVATSTSVGFFNDNEFFGLATEARVVTANGRAFETTWDTVSRTWTTRTPLGRVTRVVVDEKERPIRLESPDDSPVALTYSPDGGQLASVTQAGRPSSPSRRSPGSTRLTCCWPPRAMPT
ncbi:MAG: hypothetical protein INH37_06875, partial [Myxococcaceae bacterium]|nr:hypothetical protein [Myxococcaceae bacterium]